MFTLSETVCLAEWIIDDTCLVMTIFENFPILRLGLTREKWVNYPISKRKKGGLIIVWEMAGQNAKSRSWKFRHFWKRNTHFWPTRPRRPNKWSLLSDVVSVRQSVQENKNLQKTLHGVWWVTKFARLVPIFLSEIYNNIIHPFTVKLRIKSYMAVEW